MIFKEYADAPGTTMLEKMKWLETEGDELRRRMLREPRGYPPLCCNLMLPPTWGGMFYFINENFRHEGILGTIFTGQLVKETQVGPTRRWCLQSAGRHGSQALLTTSLILPTLFPTASQRGISGRERGTTAL